MTRLLSALLLFAALALPSQVSAQGSGGAAEAERGRSGLPVPRFVSLSAGEARMRTGPGRDFPVDWLFVREGLPMEVIDEWGIYRKLRSPDGAEGWMNKALLSGARTGMVYGKIATLRARPEEGAPPVWRAEPGVIGRLQVCEGGWCRFQVGGRAGYIRKDDIWGVYPGERIE